MGVRDYAYRLSFVTGIRKPQIIGEGSFCVMEHLDSVFSPLVSAG
jgi:hypothetical protein